MSKRDSRRSSLERRLGRRIRLARLALAWERLWPSLWPAPVIVGAFVALALFDVLPQLSTKLHFIVLAMFGAALLFAIGRAVLSFRWPERSEGERRVEQASGLRHRPVTTLADSPVTTGHEEAVIWNAHQRRTAAMLRRLRTGPPRSTLARRDPMALRIATALIVIVGFVIAGDSAPDRVARAFTPGLGGPPKQAPIVDLWVEPPAYTGLAPVYARDDRPKLTFPAGSTIVARVGGGDELPSLAVDSAETVFKSVGEQSYELKTEVEQGQRITIEQDGDVLASWELEVVPDMPPTVSMPRPPSPTQRHAIRIDYEADDDYGVVKMGIELRRAAGTDPSVDEGVLELPIPVPGIHTRRVQGSAYHDLTAHAWAGSEVELRLIAIDGAEQQSETAPVRLQLPERVFTHPVARAIIAERKRLAHDSAARAATFRRLGAIARMTDLYDNDTVVFLALSTARARLRHDDAESAIDSVRDLLWDTALRLEDGNLSIAERELREAQRALLDALSRDAPQQEIDRLIEQLWAAIQKYLQTMMAQADDLPPLSQEEMQSMQTLEQQDLREMLQRMRELTQAGARDAAMQMLAQLQNMLENLRQARLAGQSGQNAAEMMQMMQQLQELAARQQGLMDETFRNGQRDGGQQGRTQMGQPQMGQQGQGQMPSLSDLAGQQEQLRRMLGDFMRRFGERNGQIPGGLGRAERAMRDAIDALQREQAGQAVGSQTEALDQLQQAGRALAREMARQMGMGEPQQGQTGTPDQRFDPLGRPPGGYGLNTQDVVIPTESDLQRARRIRDELHQRSGDRIRPEFERDYIERLLERF